jgi:long-subunit fatty acid transport protein
MKLVFGVLGTFVAVSGSARAGGLYLPGAGAVSTMRAGASVAATDDAEAISLNPAGIAKSSGTVITIGFAAIDFAESFQRAGVYPMIKEQATTYAGQPFPKMTNTAKPPLGLGSMQPVPVIGIVSDLGNKISGLHVGFGIYAPNAYPFRDFNTVNGKQFFVPPSGSSKGYTFDPSKLGPGDAPPPTRYDALHQEAAIILPSIAVAYHIPSIDLDVGGRFSAGFATLKSAVALWGNPGNYEEWVQSDGLFTLDATAVGVTTGALGVAYRPIKSFELAFDYDFPISAHAQGRAVSDQGPAVAIGMAPVVVSPVTGSAARCADGGTSASDLKGCVDLVLPMKATLAARYRFLDDRGRERGDLELDVGWENWGGHPCDYVNDSTCADPGDFRVVVDALAGTKPNDPGGISLKDQKIMHGFQDVYNVRVGGSWSWASGANRIIARGGLSYDTAAAKTGWERLDFDGAARTMIALGASYELPRWRFDLGFGYIYEGTRTQNRGCVTDGSPGNAGCGPGGVQQNLPDRQGPDPLSPIVVPAQQLEHPVNEGTFDSHYVLVMLGARYAF